MLRFTLNGDLAERLFVPAEEAAARLAKFPSAAQNDSWLIAWRADSKSMPPLWLSTDKVDSGLWRSVSGNLIQPLARQIGSTDLVWRPTKGECRNLLAGR